MIEIRGDKKVLITPISEEDLADIKIGDIVWLDGELMTCRDVAHRRLVEYGRELPYDIRDKAIFHAGPIVRKIEGTEDDYEMVSIGPTTSMRMEKFEYEFTKLTGVRVIVGKGGMGPNTERAYRIRKGHGCRSKKWTAWKSLYFFRKILPGASGSDRRYRREKGDEEIHAGCGSSGGIR